MKIEDLVELLNNRLREYKLSQNYASMNGDLEKVNIVDKEILELENTLFELNLLIDTSNSSAVKESTLAGALTDGSVAVLGEYDITPYATDPLHEEKVMTILSNMAIMGTIEKVDDYIKGKYFSSPVTGEMVISAAEAYTVDERLMMAIMEQDSRFGTAGVAVRTLNPGNVGNTDDGSTRTYDSWQEGVTAVAEWLSRHRGSTITPEIPEETVFEPMATSTPTIATTTPSIATSTPSTSTTTPATIISTSTTATSTPSTATTTPGIIIPTATDTATTTPATDTSGQDTEAPVITIQGNNPAEISVGTAYVDLGATVTDNVNDNLGITTLVDGVETTTVSLDTSTSTTYTITYTATDQAGNTGTAERTVIVGEVITVIDDTPTDTATTTPGIIIPVETGTATTTPVTSTSTPSTATTTPTTATSTPSTTTPVTTTTTPVTATSTPITATTTPETIPIETETATTTPVTATSTPTTDTTTN